jgi:Tfp pilus assembly protein PilN
MKLRLNLASNPLENNRRFLFGATLVGALAGFAFLLLSAAAVRNWSNNRALRAEVSDLEQKMRDFRGQRRELDDFFRRPETRKLMDRAAFLNSLIEQRSFPWTRIFSDLERRLPDGVRVLAISPFMREGRVHLRLIVGARSDEAKLKFLATLEDSPEFSSLQVVSDGRGRSGEPDEVVLEMAAVYAAELPPLDESDAGKKREREKAAGDEEAVTAKPRANAETKQPAAGKAVAKGGRLQ